jgi:competence protein ComEC
MKLPSLFPVTFFAGGILLFARFPYCSIVTLRFCLAAIVVALACGWLALHRKWTGTAAIFAAGAWISLGFATSGFERASTPANLASTLIESGKLDGSVALRWHGRLRSDPLELPWGIRYELRLEEVETGAGVTPVGGGLRLTYYRSDSSAGGPAIAQAGDEIEVFARAIPVRNFGDPGSFDYRGYLARQDIQLQGTLRNAALLTVVGRPRLTISERFARLRGRFLRSIDDLFPSQPEEGALARAMLLGDRSFVEHDRVVDFQKTGVYHVLVLAGLHVGILTAFFLWVGRRLRLRLGSRVLLTLLVLAAYLSIVEDRPPILRAVLMAALYLCAQLFYRRMDLPNIAALAAVAILVVRPSEISDPSFLLSFAAVAAIGAIAIPCMNWWIEPRRRALGHLSDVTRDPGHAPRQIQFRLEMRAAINWVGARLPRFAAPFASGLLVLPSRAAIYLVEIIFISSVLQLGMLPFLVYYFHRVAWTGPLANIPAVLLTGIAVPLGFFTLAASLVSHSLAAAFAKLLGVVLRSLNATVGWFAAWHGVSHRVPGPPLALILAFVACAIAVSAAIRTRCRLWWLTGAATIFLATAGLVATYPFSPRFAVGKLEFTALDVGQGDSLFLAFPHGKTMLVDAGGALANFQMGGMRSGIDIGEDVVSPYLWSRGLKQIDVVALTHAHEDHIGGLPAILENFRVHELWVGRDVESGAYRHALAVARAQGVLVRHMKQGDSFSEDGVAGEILWPDDLSEGSAAKNDDSLVMRLTDGAQSFLLAGDIERPSERKILDEGQRVEVNFLKIAHHGSRTSTTDAFLSAAHPAFGAISVGRDNSFGHPSPEVVDRLESAGVRVYRTDRDGAITASTDGATLKVRTFLEDAREHSRSQGNLPITTASSQ